jgi:hypothetical protein
MTGGPSLSTAVAPRDVQLEAESQPCTTIDAAAATLQCVPITAHACWIFKALLRGSSPRPRKMGGPATISTAFGGMATLLPRAVLGLCFQDGLLP